MIADSGGAFASYLPPSRSRSRASGNQLSAIIHQLTDLPAAMNPRRLKSVYERNNRVRREGTANLIGAARAAGVSRLVVQSMGTW